ncbi:MAG: hypothetical protein B6D59_01555 [Campylobacteraceae bacterium 4484_4]|nr:MAG: hypothetical protein B6D59_01555 [Campylobacteraceae bacterium 4484_4]
MKIAIIGTGGVGGYLGAKLLKAHPDLILTCVARGAHLKAIRENGLTIIEDESRFTVHPAIATDDLSAIPPQDLILFCTKSYDLAKSAAKLSKSITKDTVLLPLLNGVDHDLTLKSLYPDAEVLDGCVYILSEIEKAGHIRKKGPFFYMVIGNREGGSERYNDIAGLFNEAGLKTKLTDRIVYETWKKYLFIGAFAMITSYYDKSIGWVMEHRPEEAETLLREIIAVANAKMIPLGNEDYLRALKQARNIPYDSKTSMQRDFEAHRPTELESLGGYIVKEAQFLKVATPLMERFYKTLKEKSKK